MTHRYIIGEVFLFDLDVTWNLRKVTCFQEKLAIFSLHTWRGARPVCSTGTATLRKFQVTSRSNRKISPTSAMFFFFFFCFPSALMNATAFRMSSIRNLKDDHCVNVGVIRRCSSLRPCSTWRMQFHVVSNCKLMERNGAVQFWNEQYWQQIQHQLTSSSGRGWCGSRSGCLGSLYWWWAAGNGKWMIIYQAIFTILTIAVGTVLCGVGRAGVRCQWRRSCQQGCQRRSGCYLLVVGIAVGCGGTYAPWCHRRCDIVYDSFHVPQEQDSSVK